MLKGVYLCARAHRLPKYDIDYNDIEYYDGINLLCSCEDVDISKYDYIIATPPCNYWSHANYRRKTSLVSQKTKHLLKYCLETCLSSGKPFLVENVCNEPLFKKELGNLYNSCMCFVFGNHTFFTNTFFFVPSSDEAQFQNKQYVSRLQRDNNYNVDLIIKKFLEVIHNG